MNPENNIFNGAGNNGNSAPQPQNQPQPMSSNQPFFGFGGGSEGGGQTMPQNQGVFTPVQPITSSPGQMTPADYQAQQQAQQAAQMPQSPQPQGMAGMMNVNQGQNMAGQGLNDQVQGVDNNLPGMPQSQSIASGKRRMYGRNETRPMSLEEQGKVQQTIKKFMILSIVLGVGAVIFLFLGIWGLVDAISTRGRLSEVQKTANNYGAIITELENQTSTKIETVDDLPVYTPAGRMIYLTDWEIKLKIPETLTSVSYILNQNANYHSYVCFNGLQEGTQYFPAFADINQNRNGMGCLYRIPVAEGSADSNGNSYGQEVLVSGDYRYFYKAPNGNFAATDAEKGLENSAITLIKEMITDGISTYQ